MRALYKAPHDQGFRELVVPNDLHTLQDLVGGGNIETVTFATDAVIVCNEEGRLKGMPYNCSFCGWELVGPILILGVDRDEFCDCPMSMTMANGGISK